MARDRAPARRKFAVAGARLYVYSPSGLERYQFAAGHYNADGTPDTSFDGDGFALTDLAPGGSEAMDVAVQPDSRIVAAG